MSPQLATDMPPQRGPAMRSLRWVHAPHAGSRQHQRRFTRTTAPNPASPGSRGGQRCGRQCRWGRLARPVAQVAAELGVAWHTVMDSVPDGA
jgi:hypothetical protein